SNPETFPFLGWLSETSEEGLASPAPKIADWSCADLFCSGRDGVELFWRCASSIASDCVCFCGCAAFDNTQADRIVNVAQTCLDTFFFIDNPFKHVWRASRVLKTRAIDAPQTRRRPHRQC